MRGIGVLVGAVLPLLPNSNSKNTALHLHTVHTTTILVVGIVGGVVIGCGARLLLLLQAGCGRQPVGSQRPRARGRRRARSAQQSVVAGSRRSRQY